MTTTTEAPEVRTGESNAHENDPNTSPKSIETKLGGAEDEGNVSRATGHFHMNLPKHQQRKRKRPIKPAKSSGSPTASSNVFGDEEDEEESKNSRQNLLTMSLSASSSSSDEEDALKTSSPNKDMDVESDSNHSPETRRPQHEMVQTNNSNDSESKNMAQDGPVEPSGQNDDGNNQKSPPLGKKLSTADSNSGGNADSKKTQQHQAQPEGWRVKLYRLNADGSWDDCGTGRILCLYKPRPNDGTNNGNDNSLTSPNAQSNDNDPNSDSAIYVELGEPTLCMHSEVSNAMNRNNNSIQQQSGINNQSNNTNHVNNTGSSNPRILLRTRILLRDAYQRQGDNIITWCEPYLEEGNPAQGVDLALSFQDNAGCIDIWRQITQVQSKANEKFRLRQQQQQSNTNINATGNVETTKTIGVLENNHGRSLADLAHNVAAAHHANIQQQRQELWANAEASQPQNGMVNNSQNNNSNNNEARHAFEDAMGGIVEAYRNAAGGNAGANALGALASPQLPNPPTVESLEEITDTIATVQVRNTLYCL